MTGERPAPAVLPPGKRPVTYCTGGCGPQGWSRKGGKNFAPTRSDPRAVSTEGVRIITVNRN
jgi:hypothetical protein